MTGALIDTEPVLKALGRDVQQALAEMRKAVARGDLAAANNFRQFADGITYAAEMLDAVATKAAKAPPIKKRTPKQVILTHIINEHGHTPPSSWNFPQMSEWHAKQHHRFQCDHYHEGPNTGADDRPPGWYTGEDFRPRHSALNHHHEDEKIG